MDKADLSKKPCQAKLGRAGGSQEVPALGCESRSQKWWSSTTQALHPVNCSFYVLFLRTLASHMYTCTGMYLNIYIYTYVYICIHTTHYSICIHCPFDVYRHGVASCPRRRAIASEAGSAYVLGSGGEDHVGYSKWFSSGLQ